MKSQLDNLITLIQTYLSNAQTEKQQIKNLHKLRVAARKLVAISEPESFQLQVFKKVIQNSNSIRDIDVFTSETLANFPKKWQSELEELHSKISEFRDYLDIKYKLILATEIIDDIERLKPNLKSLEKPSVSTIAQRQKLSITEINKQLNKQIKVIQKIDIEDKYLHKSRLKIKRLRYQLEHFHHDEKTTLKLCTYLQDQLGHFHDLCQAVKLLQKHHELISATQLAQYQAYLETLKLSLLKEVRAKLRKV